MPRSEFDIPILLLVFNRANNTNRVLNQIKRINPSKIYISGDGPRAYVASDYLAVKAVVDVIESIDWCQNVHVKFQAENLGCRRAVERGIDWFFENEEMGIILEDDCVPSLSFFSFSRAMLRKYVDNYEVFAISGNLIVPSWYRLLCMRGLSHTFCRYGHFWGWATWKRSWSEYDGKVSFWRSLISTEEWKSSLPLDSERRFWSDLVPRVESIDTWDFQWLLCINKCRGLIVIPPRNLVSNIGFEKNATHTTSIKSPLASLIAHEIKVGQPEKMALENNHMLAYYEFFINFHGWKFIRIFRFLRFARLKILEVFSGQKK